MNCKKIKFKTANAAEKQIAKWERSRTTRRGSYVPLRVYRCPDCGLYHTTSDKPILGLDKTSPVPLKKIDEWSKLIEKQNRRENPFNMQPFFDQLERAEKIIIRNINVNCELLRLKMDHRIKLWKSKHKIKTT